MRLLARRGLLGAAVIAVVASGTLGVGLAEAVGRHSATPVRYGGLPSYLPSSSIHPDSTLTGTAAHPALTSEGDAVRVELPRGGSVRAVVAGPVVPGEGLPYQATADTATWTVTLSGATRRIPISLQSFSVIDSLGKVYRPALVPGQRRPPAVITPGHTVQFELRVVLAVGEGMLRWAPQANDLLATWDFVVEND